MSVDFVQNADGTFTARISGQTRIGSREQCEAWFRASNVDTPSPRAFLSLSWKEICDQCVEAERAKVEMETSEIPAVEPPDTIADWMHRR